MRRSALRMAALAALPLLLSGCDLLYYYLDPLGQPPGDFGPTEPAQFLSGTATLEITQGGETQTVALEQVSADSYLDPSYGGWVTWTSAEGWSVMVNAYDASLSAGIEVPGWIGDVTINRVQGDDYWTAGTYTDWSSGGCFVNVWELTATKLNGHVNCTTLRWADGRNTSFDSSAYVENQEEFDVSIDFAVEGTPEAPGQNG